MFVKNVLVPRLGRYLVKSDLHTSSALCKDADLILSSTKNNVTTLMFNNPKKLNAWTVPMFENMFDLLTKHGKDDNTKVLILTGSGPYYCAGANLSENVKLMHPKKLHSMIIKSNNRIFNYFLDFPKPILVAANGPAIGASVTSAALCDGIIAGENATFWTPFAKLCVTPEGCSSVHFERILGKEAADKMLDENWKVSAEDAKRIGLVLDVVPQAELLLKSQELGETWVAEGRKRTIPGGGQVAEYKEINLKESHVLADAFISYKFLDAQYDFLKSKGKLREARMFWILKTLQPLWSKLV